MVPIVWIVALTLAAFVLRVTTRERDDEVLSESHGYLKAGHKGVAFELLNDERILHYVAGSGKVLAPAGTYGLASWHVETRHDGEDWYIGGEGSEDEEPVEIHPGETTIMGLGLPFSVSVSVGRGKDLVYFQLMLTTQDGRDFSPDTIRRNGERVEPARVKILNARGQTVAAGKFEYG